MAEIRCSIELRQDESRQSPGRLYGVLMEYEKRASDRPEMFLPGALQWPENGIILNESHDQKAVITRFKPEQRGNEIIIDTPLPDTSRGRDAATLIRNGTMTGLSVEFISLLEQRNAGVREIRKAKLTAAGLVADASYKGNLEIRNQSNTRRRWWR